MRTFRLLAPVVALLAVAACSQEPDDLDVGTLPETEALEGLFVPISKQLSTEEIAERKSTLAAVGVSTQALSTEEEEEEEDFYVAVHRSALEGSWFMSTYLKQLHPFGPSPETLGTRVVSMEIQNGRLYVFDVDNRRQTSDVFDPELILEAYPIVEERRFRRMAGWRDYVFIDPSAGLNRFGALADAFGGGGQVAVETELSFLRRFRSFDDGVSYEQVFTAYADGPIGATGDVEENDRRVAGTLGVSWRRYSEGTNFQTVDPPPASHYFLSEPRKVPNTGQIAQYAAHWDFYEGMEPVRWVISPELVGIDEASEANLVDAVIAGIESWNDAFGFTVFTAEVASPDDSFAEDRTNYFIVDTDSSLGFAYANWRTNPNTGEIRGASVYMSSVFFQTGFADDPEETALRGPKPAVPMITWNGEANVPPCALWAEDGFTQTGESQLTAVEKLEAYVQFVAAHEVGHTIGLRHNFHGSLLPPSSSVMEYSLADDAVAQPTPGPYDVEAIQYLYGLSSELPTLPFCTDEDTLFDPTCVRFDTGDPLGFQLSEWSFFSGLFLDFGLPPDLIGQFFGSYGGGTAGFVRAGGPELANIAWNALTARIAAPVAPEDLSIPFFAVAADQLLAAIYRELYLAPTGSITLPVSDPEIVQAIADQANEVLINSDGVRSYDSRRLIVDALKAAQNVASLQVLLSAREVLGLQVASGELTPTDEALTRDLMSRIDSVTSPYFP